MEIVGVIQSEHTYDMHKNLRHMMCTNMNIPCMNLGNLVFGLDIFFTWQCLRLKEEESFLQPKTKLLFPVILISKEIRGWKSPQCVGGSVLDREENRSSVYISLWLSGKLILKINNGCNDECDSNYNRPYNLLNKNTIGFELILVDLRSIRVKGNKSLLT